MIIFKIFLVWSVITLTLAMIRQHRIVKLVRKYDAIGKFAWKGTGGFIFVNWRNKSIPIEFTKEYKKYVEKYSIIFFSFAVVELILIVILISM